MTHQQYLRMLERVEIYRSLHGFVQTLEEQLGKLRQYGNGGFNIEFIGVTCKISGYKQITDRLLPEIEKVYRTVIAECHRDMSNIDLEISK